MTALPIGRVTTRSSEGVRLSGRHPDRIWRILAWIAPLVAALLSVYIAWGAGHPSFPFDEVDQLQMSRLIAGLSVPDVRGAGYYPLWSFLIAPVWWVTSDPFVAYAVVLGAGVLVGLVSIVPLTFIGRRMRLTTSQAIVAASIVTMTPAIALQSDYALSERLLLLTVATAVLVAWRLWETPTVLRAAMFGLAVGAMYFTHVRVLAVVIASAVWIVLFAVRNWRVAIVGLVSLVVFAAAAYYFGKHLNIALLGSFDQGESLTDTLRASRPGLLLRSALGQAWAQVVGSFGLAAVGFVALLNWSWQELRRLRAGRATYVLAIVLAMYALTTVKWASDYHLFTRPWHRLDIWLYGRYVDPFTMLLVLVAIAVIIRGIRRSTWLWSAAASAAVIVPTVFWLAREAPAWGYITPAHIPGVMPWAWALPTGGSPQDTAVVPTLWNDNSFWAWASLSTIAMLLLILILRRFSTVLAVVLAVSFVASSVSADHASDAFHDLEGVPPAFLTDLRDTVSELDPIAVQFDTGCSDEGGRDSVTMNYYGYWLLPGVLTTFDSREEQATADLIISCAGEAPPGAPDAVEIPDTLFRERTLWVRPGPLADAIQANGMLP